MTQRQKILVYFLISLSLSNLIFLPIWEQNLLSRNEFFLKAPFPSPEITATILNVLFLSVLLWILSIIQIRPRRTTIIMVFHAAFLVLFLIPINHIRTSFKGLEVMVLMDQIGWVAGMFLVMLIVVLLSVAFLRWRRQIVSTAAVILICFVPFVFVTFAQAARMVFADRQISFQDKPLSAPLGLNERNPRRIVWMIFDQMDQRIAFEERPTSFDMPEFDRLLNESFMAENAYPPAGWTVVSMPALINGKLVSKAKPLSPDRIDITFADGDQPVSWGALPNIFSKARGYGLNTGLGGWDLPYCRLISESLTRCSWYSDLEWLRFSRTSVPSKMLQQVVDVIFRLRLMRGVQWVSKAKQDFESQDRRIRRRYGIGNYKSFFASAISLVTDPNLDPNTKGRTYFVVGQPFLTNEI